MEEVARRRVARPGPWLLLVLLPLVFLSLLHPSPVPARHAGAAAVPSWPHSEHWEATGPHWLDARPRDASQTAGIFANSYWQLVGRRPEILQTFYTESRRMKICEIDQCWVSSMSKFRAELWEVMGLKVVGEGPHPVR